MGKRYKLLLAIITSSLLIPLNVLADEVDYYEVKEEARVIWDYFVNEYGLYQSVEETFPGNEFNFKIEGHTLNGTGQQVTSKYPIECTAIYAYNDVGPPANNYKCTVDNRSFIPNIYVPEKNVRVIERDRVNHFRGNLPFLKYTGKKPIPSSYTDDGIALYYDTYWGNQILVLDTKGYYLTRENFQFLFPSGSNAKNTIKKIYTLNFGSYRRYVVEYAFSSSTYYKIKLSNLKNFNLLNPLYYGYKNNMTDDQKVIYGLDISGRVIQEVENKSKNLEQSLNKSNEDFKSFFDGNNNSINEFSSTARESMSLLSNAKFISSFAFVGNQFNRLINGTPFYQLLTYSLLIGLCLLMLGKYRG